MNQRRLLKAAGLLCSIAALGAISSDAKKAKKDKKAKKEVEKSKPADSAASTKDKKVKLHFEVKSAEARKLTNLKLYEDYVKGRTTPTVLLLQNESDCESDQALCKDKQEILHKELDKKVLEFEYNAISQ